MRKFGFKLFSTNLQTAPNIIKESVDFATLNKDVFIELMVVPTSSEEDLSEIKKQIGDNVEVRLHAAHCGLGFDAGNKNLEKQNRELFAQAQRTADIFGAKTIVVHAGCGHGDEYIKETVRQFKLFNDKRIVVENLPYVNDKNEARHGNYAGEIKYIMQETGCGFCFDFSHAICAALRLNIDIEKQLKAFFDLKPTVYHMCDGDTTKAEDLHMHFGEGNYPLEHYLNDFTDENAYITMETGHGPAKHGDVWIKDYNYLKKIQSEAFK